MVATALEPSKPPANTPLVDELQAASELLTDVKVPKLVEFPKVENVT
jgi:hypothetical protein